MTQHALFACEGIRVGSGAGTILRDVAIRCPAGAVVGLMGTNGSGKTTLVDVLSGLRPAEAGRITLAGIDVSRWSLRRRSSAGILRGFQTTHLYAALSVLENVMVAFRNQPGEGLDGLMRPIQSHRSDLKVRADAMSLLDLVGLERLANEPARVLSHGQRILLFLAQAAAFSPRVLLLDEPFAGLHRDSISFAVDEIRRHASRGTAVLLIDHDEASLRALATTINILENGTIVSADTETTNGC